MEALVYPENPFRGIRAEALEALLAFSVTREAEASAYLLMEWVGDEEAERIVDLFGKEGGEGELMDYVDGLLRKYGLPA